MSYNKKLLKQMVEESKQKKPQPKPKDRIVDPMGQWAHPGQVTRIPSNRITMQGVPYPVLAKSSSGAEGVMYPDQEYFFPDSTYVDEYPMMKNGGDISIPNLEEGNWLNRYDEGGLTTTETTRPPIYVDNPNDPRLKAYNDSLTLYNYYNKIENLAKSKNIEDFRKEVKYLDEEALKASNRLMSLNKRPPSLDLKGESIKVGNTLMTYLKGKKPVQPVVYKKPNNKIVDKLTRTEQFIPKPKPKEQPQLKMVGNEIDRSLSFPIPNIVAKSPAPLQQKQGDYVLRFQEYDEEGNPINREIFSNDRKELDDIMNFLSQQGRKYNNISTQGNYQPRVYKRGGSLPKFQFAGERKNGVGDIGNRGISDAQKKYLKYIINQEKKIDKIQKETGLNRNLAIQINHQQKTKPITQLNQTEYRSDVQKRKAQERLDQLKQYREKALGIPEGTTQADIDRNRKNNERLLNAIDVGLILEGGLSLAGLAGRKTLPALGEYLTTQTPLRNAYKINPWGLKENPEMFLYRARPVGQDINMNMAAQIRAKQASGEPLMWWEKNLLNPQTNPQMLAREKYYGQWFEKDPMRLDWYIDPSTRNFGDFDNIEILRTKLPKSQAAAFNVSKYPDAKVLSASPETEFILPKDMIESAERFPEASWKQLVDEDKAFNKPNWLRGYKQVKPTSVSSSVGDVVDFSKYPSQLEAVQARAERLLSQKHKKGWNEQLTPNLEERLSTAVQRHDVAGDYPGTKLGANVSGRTETLVSKDANIKGVPLTEPQKSMIAAHETGHYYSNSLKEGTDWQKYFDFSDLPYKTRKYLKGKSNYNNFSNEIRERAAQLKDYIAFKNKIPLNQDFKITRAQFDDALENYIKNTGLDNTMTPFIRALKKKGNISGFLKEMNKRPLSVVPYIGIGGAGVLGAGALQQKKKGGQTNNWLNNYK